MPLVTAQLAQSHWNALRTGLDAHHLYGVIARLRGNTNRTKDFQKKKRAKLIAQGGHFLKDCLFANFITIF
jgi:hypothetical protein